MTLWLEEATGREAGYEELQEVPEIAFEGGQLRITAPAGASSRYTLDGTEPNAGSTLYTGPATVRPSAAVARTVYLSTSPQWRRPLDPGPQAIVVRARIVDGGRMGPVVNHTFGLADHPGMAVLALTIDPAALFDPDQGIYVPGMAVFKNEVDAVERYPRVNKWWWYPGNYHGRGKDWEREGRLTIFQAGDALMDDVPVRLRINGNNTRGFAQHSLRVLWDKPGSPLALFGEELGDGQRAAIIRAAGNDQDRAFCRDALQHGLCADMPFDVGYSRLMVLYVNGAYWGMHHLRSRMDEKEIARRYGLRNKEVVLMADDLEHKAGSDSLAGRFSKLLWLAENGEAGPRTDSLLAARIDLESFLGYMAAQVVLGNTDWPVHNVGWWCYGGQPGEGVRDGRWRWIMGDSDLGFGFNEGPGTDQFQRLLKDRSVTARLFRGVLRSPRIAARWEEVLTTMCAEQLTAQRMLQAVDNMQSDLAPEMGRHVSRWRRPLSERRWLEAMDELRTFARERPAVVLQQWQRHRNGFL